MYATPTTPATPEDFASRYDSSIVVRRWGATWFDFALFALLLVVAVMALPKDFQTGAIGVVAFIVLSYFPVLEHLYGRTLGKLICRVRVVDMAGGMPSWGQATIRTFLRLIEVNPALLGGIPAGIIVLSSKKRQRLGDMAANTLVLREEDYRYLCRLRDSSPSLGSFRPGAIPAPAPIPPPLPAGTDGIKWLVPINRSGWSIAAGYLGLFAVLIVPAPVALVAGLLGLRQIRRTPGLGGKGRAIFGIVMGGLFSAILVAVVIVTLVSPPAAAPVAR